jgi:2,5-diketo-D-gluconate reductase A
MWHTVNVTHTPPDHTPPDIEGAQMSVPNVLLNNGVQIPQLGFGVFQIPPEETAAAVKLALSVGYRHIDTAQMYGNEAGVAAGIADSGVDPDEVFVTSKLNNSFHAYDDALRAFDATLAALKTERVDLFLIHWPLATVSDFVPTWKALETIYREGRARAIGVSNFNAHHLRKLHAETEIVPAVNQIEAHPYLTQNELRAFDAEHGIATEAWSPIAQGGVLKDPVITDLAASYGKTPAQVVLRWHLQLGNIVFPKSVTEDRVRENFDLFDFELSGADLGIVSSLNKDERTGPDPDTFAMIPA